MISLNQRTQTIFVKVFIVTLMCILFQGGQGQNNCDGGVTTIRVQLQWIIQAQFAGFVAADLRGFYTDECLYVLLLPGGATLPEAELVEGRAQFGVGWMARQLTNRYVGALDLRGDLQVYNATRIAQHFHNEGLVMVSWKDSGIVSPSDWVGKTVGYWPTGLHYRIIAAAKKRNLTWCFECPNAGSYTPCCGAGEPGVEADFVLSEQWFEMTSFSQRQLYDVVSAMTYNEYAQLLETVDEETGQLLSQDLFNIFDFTSDETGLLEDGILVDQEWISLPGNEDLAVRFLRATLRGWIYCRDNEAACVSMFANKGYHQQWQMGEVNALVWPAPYGVGMPAEGAMAANAQRAFSTGMIDVLPPADEFSRFDLAQRALDSLQADYGLDVFGLSNVTHERDEFCLSATGAIEICEPCPPGTYFVNVTRFCSRCPEGLYQPFEGQFGCLECGDDEYSAGGATGCSYCFVENDEDAEADLVVVDDDTAQRQCTAPCHEKDLQYVVSACLASSERRTVTFAWLTPKRCQGGIALPRETEMECDMVPATSATGSVVTIVSIAGAVISLGFALAVIKYRRTSVIRQSQLMFCLTFCLGAICCCLSMLAFVGENSDTSCMLRPWLLHPSITIMTGGLFVKLHRVDKLFNNPNLRRITVTNAMLFNRLARMVAVDVIILLVWTLKDPSRAVTEEEVVAGVGEVLRTRCVSDASSLPTVAFCWKAGLMLNGCRLAYNVRHVDSRFSESKHIFMGIYNISFVGGLTLIVTETMGVATSSALLLQALGMAWCCVASLGLVLGPKFMRLSAVTSTTDDNSEMMKNNNMSSKSGLGGTTNTAGGGGGEDKVIIARQQAELQHMARSNEEFKRVNNEMAATIERLEAQVAELLLGQKEREEMTANKDFDDDVVVVASVSPSPDTTDGGAAAAAAAAASLAVSSAGEEESTATKQQGTGDKRIAKRTSSGT